jgi:hypothetical protein
VVFLDLSQLSVSLSAAKQQRQQQHADASGVDQDSAARLQRGSSSDCSESAALDSHLILPDGTSSAAEQAQQQQHAVSGICSQRPAPLALETIFSSGPAYAGMPGGRSNHGAGSSMQPQHHSSSMPTPEAGHGSMGPPSAGQQAVSSLFGGSFEVPFAIASCWAQTDNQGSFSSNAGVKHQALEALAAADGCGSSSMASGSSTRSFAGPAAASTAPAGATPARPATGSRLRNASGMQAGDGAHAEPAAANSIDVCTPRSGIAAPGGVDRSPLHSSADCEEDAEYSEAALVFGSVTAAGGNTALAAAAAGGAAAGAEESEVAPDAGRGTGQGVGSSAADASGRLEAEESFSMDGVDWSRMVGLQPQQQQQQQTEASYSYQQQQALLFGLDDFRQDGLTPRSSSGGGAAAAAAMASRAHSNALAAAATGALTARRLLMEHTGRLQRHVLPTQAAGAVVPSAHGCVADTHPLT